MRRPLILDVSNNNPIGTTLLRESGAVGLIAKATEGSHFQDHTYRMHRDVARECGVPFGAYLFLHADSVGNEAEYFLHYAQPRKGDIQPIVDAEVGDPRAAAHRSLACLQDLASRGYRPLLYSSWAFLRSMLKTVPALHTYRVWEAAYTPFRLPVGLGATVVLWQFSQTYEIGGRRFDASRLLVPLDSLRI